MPIGVVVKCSPGATKWARWAWKAIAVLPGAGAADWRVLREEGECVIYHAATPELELYAADAEAYIHGLMAETPSIYVILRETGRSESPFDVVLVTASPYEAQDYADSGEEIVEKIPMPPALLDWVRDFAEAHHNDESFRKRRRDRIDVDKTEDGVGDPRIHQMRDVYRSPRLMRKGRLQ